MDTLTASGLVLEPLIVAHAEAMFNVLSDPCLYRYLDYGPPPSLEHLRTVYTRLETRVSPDGTQRWLNWVVRKVSGAVVGYVQATLVASGSAWIAYLLAREHWGRGYARAATSAMLAHLEDAYRCTQFLATVEAANLRSVAVLEALSFRPATPAELRFHELTPTELLFVRRVPAHENMSTRPRTSDEP
jgi:RimJ/RimL family protein N-acetyltransferase